MIWKLMLTPLEIFIFYHGDRIIKFQSLTKRAGAKSPVPSNGVYSSRLDQAGLDSPPFDGVKALWLNPLAFIMKIFDTPVRLELKAM
jgi:hypothetical protein